MKTTKVRLIFVTILFSSSVIMAQTKLNPEKNVIEISDIQNLIGDWEGTLTYIDYTSNNPFSMPSALEIKSRKKNRKLILYYKYKNEPKANSKSKFKISKDGSELNGKSIISRLKKTEGNIQIITEYSGKDGNDNKNAKIRNIYIIGVEKFVMRKEVQFEGTNDWIMRNEYNFNKK
jgi:hypothetical protein